MSDGGEDEIAFDRAPEAAGIVRQVSPLVRRLIAGNGGPFTFTGTCSYLIGVKAVAILDPGPDDPAHLAGLLAALDGRAVSHILVTHTHRDHSPAAARLREAVGAPVWGCAPHVSRANGANQGFDAAHDPAYAPDHVMRDGEFLRGDGFTLQALATPGHAANHLCFAFVEENALFSGDHVMAWSTSVVAPPDGSMRAYMASLEKLRGRAEEIYWPGHGGPVREPQRFVRALAHHRRQRERAILGQLAKGEARVGEIVAAIYESLDGRLAGAAALSVLAHLEDLRERGLVAALGGDPLRAAYRLSGETA